MRCHTWALLCAVFACGDDNPDSAPTTEAGTSGATTYYADVRPLIDAYCVRCHGEGSLGPFALETESDVLVYRGQIVDAVESEFMPLVKECPDFAGEFTLSAAQRAVFSDWRKNDFAIGQRADFAPLAKRCVTPPDMLP